MARERVTRATPRETPRHPATEKRDASDFCATLWSLNSLTARANNSSEPGSDYRR
jgi:hypothetical protein